MEEHVGLTWDEDVRKTQRTLLIMKSDITVYHTHTPPH